MIEDDISSSRLERNLHTVIMTILTLAIVGAFNTLMSLRDDVSVMRERFTGAERRLVGLDDRINETYTRRDAIKDFALIKKDIVDIREDVDKLDRVVEKHH